jgi:hypothetical protein
MRFVTAVFSMVFAFGASAQTLDVTRYPNRLPDWLWQDDLRAPLLKEPDRREIMIEITRLIFSNCKGKPRKQMPSARPWRSD